MGKGPKGEIVIQVGDHKVKESQNEKLLGIWVEDNLSWSTHLSKLEKNLVQRFKLV